MSILLWILGTAALWFLLGIVVLILGALTVRGERNGSS